MKKIFLLLSLVAFCNLFIAAQSGWTHLTSGTNATLYSIYFTDINNGYIGGSLGRILKTTDAGNNWSVQIVCFPNYLYSIVFTNATTGYAVGSQGTILKTTDAGNTWILQSSGVTDNLSSVYFTDPLTGYIVGGSGTLLKTTDSGTSWAMQSVCSNCFPQVVYFTNSNIGYIGGHRGTILKTTDAGINWSAQGFDTVGVFLSFNFINTNNGFAVGSSIIKTSNAGTNWITQFSDSTDKMCSVFFTDVNTGYIASNYFPDPASIYYLGRILKTTNGGLNWISQLNDTTKGYSSVFFTDLNTGYVVGNNGTILKTTTGGEPSGIHKNSVDEYNLQIYPNPGNGNFTIEFVNQNKKLVKISITDITGNLLMETTSTEDKYEINEEKLSTGIFIIKVIGEKNYYGKLVVK